MKLLQAKAYMAGEAEATEDEVEVMAHTLWNTPDQIKVVERVVHKLVNPMAYEAVELEDAARALYEQRPKSGSANAIQALEPLMRQLGDIKERLESRIGRLGAQPAERKVARANQALGTITKWQGELGQMALGSISGLASAPGARS